ncbi:hypothetical protein M3Y99_00417100 [Aphelenchoides fujianensis]|nr:hypothetical protein M3Y99_00417100 [Aphelenchoides fujianensis]
MAAPAPSPGRRPNDSTPPGEATTKISDQTCPEGFAEDGDAQNSVRMNNFESSGRGRFKCCEKRCGAPFKRWNDRNAHEVSQHHYDRKLRQEAVTKACRYCGIAYRPQNVKAHEATHKRTEGKKCRVCRSRFTQKSSRNEHERVLHQYDRQEKCGKKTLAADGQTTEKLSV